MRTRVSRGGGPGARRLYAVEMGTKGLVDSEQQHVMYYYVFVCGRYTPRVRRVEDLVRGLECGGRRFEKEN